jgi:hypothetical protein
MPLSDDWKKTAMLVTGHFEDASDPWAAVSGSADGEGISLGVLQWNIGQGTLQPLVAGMDRAAVLAAMPQYGAELWEASTAPIPRGLDIVRSWQQGRSLLPAAQQELKTLARTPTFIDRQLAAGNSIAASAWAGAVGWAQGSRNAAPSLREFCWMFDVITQNGGLKSVTPESTKRFMDSHGPETLDAVILDWLSARDSSDSGYQDARRNAALWRNGLGPSKIMLMAASYLRAGLARRQFRADVLNRKGTIVMGAGWLHGAQVDLSALIPPATEA